MITGMNKTITYCQFSNELINNGSYTDISHKYYNGIYQYRKNDGYYKDDNFFEIPLWIAELSGSINKAIPENLYIIKNIKNAIEYLKDKDIICFSVLDVNKHFIKEIADKLPNKIFFVGGYIDFSYFADNDNIKVFQTIKALVEYIGLPFEYNLNYSLFEGFKTIPRLTLSKGCLNRCKFCTIEKTITELNEFDILKQVESFKSLSFKLVYVNDKTLGQAKNHKLLYDLYNLIKEYNSDFKGFIIQTTVMQLLQLKDILKSGIIYSVELGIETFNNNILYSLCKPQTEKNIINAIELLKQYPIKIIPNIIIGLIGENIGTYNKTLNFLKAYQAHIYLLNIYNLTVYQSTPLSNEITISENDYNENSMDKSFYSEQQKADNEYFYNAIFNIGLKILSNND
jgi:hypothetical protein